MQSLWGCIPDRKETINKKHLRIVINRYNVNECTHIRRGAEARFVRAR